jgi:hypothetical protein
MEDFSVNSIASYILQAHMALLLSLLRKERQMACMIVMHKRIFSQHLWVWLMKAFFQIIPRGEEHTALFGGLRRLLSVCAGLYAQQRAFAFRLTAACSTKSGSFRSLLWLPWKISTQ